MMEYIFDNYFTGIMFELILKKLNKSRNEVDIT